MNTTIYRLAVITVFILAAVGCSVEEHTAPSGPNELGVLRLPQGEEIQKRRERFDAWKTAWIANVENRLRDAEDPYTVLDEMFDEIGEPIEPFFSDETRAAMGRAEEHGGEFTLEETIRLESDINHAVEALGISEDYIAEMANHVIMIAQKLGIEMESDAEDK